MPLHAALRTVPAALIVAAAIGSVATAQTKAPLALDTARVTIAGSSNIHEYTATSTTARVVRVKVGAVAGGAAFWDEVVRPGVLEAFELVIPAASLSSPKAGLDKNMHKALKVEQHADIAFRLARLEGPADALRAVGTLRIAGVEREVVLTLKTERRDAALIVRGQLPILMTDYGIKPPTAMLGMLKTDPKVTVSFEAILAVPLT